MYDTADNLNAQDGSFGFMETPTHETANTRLDSLEPIAVIGMALKFPQDATCTEGLWQMLIEGKSTVTEIPMNRMNIDAYFSPDPGHKGTMNIRRGHFIREDLSCFDAGFFSMSPTEASMLDPQQGWLLETTYHALENAGVPLHQVSGSSIAVHVSAFQHDHESLARKEILPQSRFSATGSLRSLMAIGLGIVAGANLICDPENMLAMAAQGFLSPNGICYSFDHRANGYSRGEGIAALVLKPISLALADGDAVRAVIRSTAINQDGRTPGGIAQPNAAAQASLIRKAYHDVHLDMARTRYIETHGAGTKLGDKIEAQAIVDAFSEVNTTIPLIVGAIKANVGHLGGAVALAGFIKTVLILERGVIPPNIHLEQLNPAIQADQGQLVFPTSSQPWPDDQPRRASVNSFGMGGSNGHAVLDDAYHYMMERNFASRQARCLLNEDHVQGPPLSSSADGLNQANGVPHVFIWSAMDQTGVSRVAKSYESYLEIVGSRRQLTASDLRSLAWTLAVRRSKFPWTSFAVAGTLDELRTNIKQGSVAMQRPGWERRVVGVFTGQGAQWHAMGRELLAYDTFRTSLRAADNIIRTVGGTWSAEHEILRDDNPNRVHDTALSQVVCVTLQPAMVDLLREWTVQLAAVVGHSSGEIAAAYCGGAISFESAIKLAYYRGLLVSQFHDSRRVLPTYGMMAVGLTELSVKQYISQLCGPVTDQKDLSIACLNSPRNVTVSGPLHRLAELQALLNSKYVFNKNLPVGVAYHSEYMASVAAQYEAILQGQLQPPAETSIGARTVIISSINGERIPPPRLRDPKYWVDSMVKPVNFVAAVSQLYLDSSPEDILHPVDCFLEIGPHSTLQSSVRDIVENACPGLQIHYHSMLQREVSAFDTVPHAMATLYCLGAQVDICKLNQSCHPDVGSQSLIVDLPPYPFSRSKTYWHESRIAHNVRFRQHPRHSLLGTAVPDWNPLQAKWRNSLVPSQSRWTAGHKVEGVDACPAAAIVAMAVEALRQVVDAHLPAPSHYQLRDVLFVKAVSAPKETSEVEAPAIETEFHLRSPAKENKIGSLWYEFSLHMLEKDEWVLCTQGSIRLICDEVKEAAWADSRASAMDQGELESRFAKCTQVMNPAELYHRLSASGLEFGPMYQGLGGVSNPFVIHPAALDSIFQMVFPAASQGWRLPLRTLIPTRLGKLTISTALASVEHSRSMKIFAETQSKGLRVVQADVAAYFDDSGSPSIEASLYVTAFRAASESDDEPSLNPRLPCHRIVARPDIDLLDNEQINYWCSMGTSPETPDLDMIQKFDSLCLAAMAKVYRRFCSADVDRPGLRRYLAWVKHVLPRKCASSKEQHDKNFHSLLEYIKEAGGVEGHLLARVAANLDRFFTGEITAVDFLLGHSSLDDMYNRGWGTGHLFAQVARFVDAMAHKNPAMRVLEVGAGLGSLTAHLLLALADTSGRTPEQAGRFTEYRYTDISSAFLNRGRDRFPGFAESGKLTFSILDIEKHTQLQSLQTGTYDLVVACNVLHATRCIEDSLSNCRRLLKPHGKLILVENTAGHRLPIGFMFGLFPGWWLGSEPHRQLSPLLSKSQWDSELRRAGFSGIDICFRDYVDPRFHLNSAMISTVANHYALIMPASITAARKLVVIIDPETLRQRQLSIELQSQGLGGECGCSVTSLADWRRNGPTSTDYVFLVEIDRPILHDISETHFAGLKALFRIARSVLWVASGSSPFTSLIYGLQRTYRAENEALLFTTYCLAGEIHPSTAGNIIKVLADAKQLLPDMAEGEYIEVDGLLSINRVVEMSTGPEDQRKIRLRELDQVQERALQLHIRHPGLLNSLYFDEVPEQKGPLQDNEIEICVQYCGLNPRDVLIALGQTHGTIIGSECAGTVVKAGRLSGFQVGDQVCSLLQSSLRTRARCNSKLVCRIPPNVDLSIAASLPVVFCSAYYALVHIARIQSRETVLIYSAAAGLGQAVIQIALLLGAEYGIPAECVLSTRSLHFPSHIRHLTGGRGVDVTISLLSDEEDLRASCECLAPFGRLIGMGSGSVEGLTSLPLSCLAENKTYASFDLNSLVDGMPDLAASLLHSVMELADASKIAAPSPLRLYGISHLEDSLREMQDGGDSGKTVLKLRTTDMILTRASPAQRFHFKPGATYVIAGGLGGLGRALARWAVSRGARWLILLSRSGVNPSDRDTLQLMKDLDLQRVNIVAPVCDISEKRALSKTLDTAMRTMPPIKGCIQAAMVLDNMRFDVMSHASFMAALKPKVQGSWNLHQLLPRRLDFFILCSSIASVVPSFGQANYAAGNSFQDALARFRVQNGEKAVSLSIGLVADVGFIAERTDLSNQLFARGWTPIYFSDLVRVLERYCDKSHPLLAPDQSHVIIGLQPRSEPRASASTSTSTNNDRAAPTAADMHRIERPLFHHIYSKLSLPMGNAPTGRSAQQQRSRMTRPHAFASKLARLLLMDCTDVDVNVAVIAYGVDSLVATELREWFWRFIRAKVGVFELQSKMTVAEVAMKATARSELLQKCTWCQQNC
ncbi:hypothetical protein BJY00DRAFT_319996 [Aspergillus carlsbadensis]|nr:hypothetical protein BJY00DRAFT_319996 [Aspergillus carlsbadensis]